MIRKKLQTVEATTHLLSLSYEVDNIIKQVTPVPVTNVLPDLKVTKNVVSFPVTTRKKEIRNMKQFQSMSRLNSFTIPCKTMALNTELTSTISHN